MFLPEKVEDVAEVGVRMERRLVTYYRRLSDAVRNPAARDAFSALAAQEEKHLGVCRSILEEVADYEPRYTYPGEYESYLDGVAGRAVLSTDALEPVIQAKSMEAALEGGIEAEKGAIAYFSKAAGRFQGAAAEGILRLVEEEKDHLARLERLKGAPDSAW